MDVCPRHRRAEVTCSSVSLAAGWAGVACVVGQLAISANAPGAPDQAACPAPGTVCVALSGSCRCNRDASCMAARCTRRMSTPLAG
jgi:hypothetical protein